MQGLFYSPRELGNLAWMLIKEVITYMINLLLITFLALLCATQVTRTTLSIYRAIFEG
jgi:hypothetical protein